MIKAILLDIDGTLTNSNKEITELTLNTLLKIQDKGIRLVLASGRPTKGLEKLSKQLEMDKHDGILISYNGALVSNAQDNTIYFSNLIKKERVLELINHLKKFELGIVLEEDKYIITEDCFNNTIKYKDKDFNVLKYESRMNDCLVKEVYSFDEYLDHDTYKVLTYGNPEYLNKHDKEFIEGFDDLNHMYSSDFYFEFTNKGIDKNTGIKKSLVEKLGIKPEEMIGFGDAQNDKSMIEYVGVGVAMGNACQELKEATNYITDDNDHDGIAKFLINYFKM